MGSLDTVWLGALLENLGQADRALALIEPVIALHHDDANYPMLINTRSWYRALTNADLDPALADANDAVRQSGGRPNNLDTRAWVQYRKGNYAAAIADAGAALAKEPKLATSLFIRALARAARGDEAGARADLAAARALRPTIDLAYAVYGLGTPAALAPPPVRSN
jgi:tetratricopeptide (TPR) repeat protein